MNYIKKLMKEITKHFKFNGNKITIYQILWNVGSWVHRENLQPQMLYTRKKD